VKQPPVASENLI